MARRHHHHCSHCGSVCRGHRAGPVASFFALVAIVATFALLGVGLHDQVLVDRAMRESRAFEEQRHFGAALEAVEAARPTLWLFGSRALDHRRAVLEFRAARPQVWPHAD